MRLRIHRGTREIGGSCVELEAAGKRLVLDLGLPLDAGGVEDTAVLLPEIEGLTKPDDSTVGLVLSHLHQDHIGLVRHVSPSLPVAIGAAARRIVDRAAPYMPDGDVLPPGPDLIDGKSLNFGPFLVTPFLTDHSAFDAYSLLVEAESSRVFYSGDLRGHGRKARIFERLIQSPPTDIDAMLMEGTTLGREGAERGFPSEDDLEEEFVNACQEASGPVLVYASAQNIDRMVTIYRAAKRTGRKLVLDIYAAAVLEATEHPTIPQLGWDDVLLYIPFRQRIHIKRNELFDDLARLSGKAVKRIFQEDLPTIGPGSVFLFRPMHASDFERANALKGALLIYSQWEGYLRDGSLKRFQDWIAKTHLPMRSIHTSGHASVGDLKRLAQAVRPKHLIPIHTFHHGRYEATFGQATILNDGEWFTVGKASS